MPTIEDIAEKIRHLVDPEYSQKVHPDQQHLHNVAKQVAEHLGIEPNALNLNHISGLINEHVERPSAEYPKMKYNHTERKEIIVANRQEENELSPDWVDHHWSAPKPEVKAEAPRGTAASVHVDDLMGGPPLSPRPRQVSGPKRSEPSPGDA